MTGATLGIPPPSVAGLKPSLLDLASSHAASVEMSPPSSVAVPRQQQREILSGRRSLAPALSANLDVQPFSDEVVRRFMSESGEKELYLSKEMQCRFGDLMSLCALYGLTVDARDGGLCLRKPENEKGQGALGSSPSTHYTVKNKRRKLFGGNASAMPSQRGADFEMGE